MTRHGRVESHDAVRHSNFCKDFGLKFSVFVLASSTEAHHTEALQHQAIRHGARTRGRCRREPVDVGYG